jgi:hypothetical protein
MARRSMANDKAVELVLVVVGVGRTENAWDDNAIMVVMAASEAMNFMVFAFVVSLAV